MIKRRAAWAGVAAVATGLGAFVAWGMLTRPVGINQDGFDRIQVGMTQREVESLLGGPPGDYTDPGRSPLDNACLPLVSIDPQSDTTGYRPESWSANGRSVVVYFRPDGTVADKSFLDLSLPLPPPSLLERFRRWLRL